MFSSKDISVLLDVKWQNEMWNKGSWHQKSLPALHTSGCYTSIYQPTLLLFRLHTAHTHTIQIRSQGVWDVERCSGDISDLFNRCWTLWVGSKSISVNWCDRWFLETRPKLFRSTTTLSLCMHITFVHMCISVHGFCLVFSYWYWLQIFKKNDV